VTVHILLFSVIFIFLCGQENETKEAARVTGLPLALLVIGAACGTRCAQTATGPTAADNCDAQARDEGANGIACGSIGRIAVASTELCFPITCSCWLCRNFKGHGKREDLTGGGLIWSAGGWAAVKALRVTDSHQKSDERILGEDAFVKRMLS
jgi:hypothetical protein